MRLHRVAADIQQNAGSEFLPLLELVLGETAYESGYLKEARAHFAEAAALGTDDLPAAASVEARANLGLMDALEGKWASGVTEVRTALEQARRMGRFALESRCRMYAARIEIVRQRFDEAIRILNEIPSDDESRTIGRELRAEVHHWRAQALAGRGDSAGARSERAGVQKLLADIEQTLPERYRPMFAARPGIRLLR
jgi:tetratricopeptide (TPR) repeat protein